MNASERKLVMEALAVAAVTLWNIYPNDFEAEFGPHLATLLEATKDVPKSAKVEAIIRQALAILDAADECKPSAKADGVVCEACRGTKTSDGRAWGSGTCNVCPACHGTGRTEGGSK